MVPAAAERLGRAVGRITHRAIPLGRDPTLTT